MQGAGTQGLAAAVAGIGNNFLYVKPFRLQVRYRLPENLC